MPPTAQKGLRETVDSIRSLSPRLNAITDLANETVRDVEHFLNEECSVGVTTCVKIAGPNDGSVGDYLEYRRVGPKFRIAIVTANDEGHDLAVKPWADSTREQKLESFKHLPDLLSRIAAEVETQIQEAEKIAKAVAAGLATLRKPAQPERR